jgi:hypothetical protein
MTQIPSNLPSSPSTSEGPRWIDLESAARLSGKHEGSLRRLCGDRWLSEGKARLVQESGKRSRWQVRTDADPAFSLQPAVPAPLAVPGAQEFRQFPQAARELAQERARILVQWAAAIAAGAALHMDREAATRRFLESLPAGSGISRPTLYRWRKAHNRDGLVGLVDGRAANRPASIATDFQSLLLEVWKSKPGFSIELAYNIAIHQARKLGWDVCSYRSAHRFLTGYQRDHKAEIILAREGEAAFTDKAAPYIPGDYSTVESNELWNADHHLFDVMVKVGERTDPKTGQTRPIHARPWLTAWQDVRSRKIVGWLIRCADPNTDAIIESLFYACKSHGLPLKIFTDNGKDFDAAILTGETKAMRWKRRRTHVEHDQRKLGGLYAAMKVQHLHVWPWHGQSKPIERFFGTIVRRFAPLFDTYCGSNPQDKPELLNGPPGQPERGALARGLAPTLEEFIEKFAGWLDADYHGQIHTGDSMDCTPNHAWEANLLRRRTTQDEVLEVLLQPRVGPVTVTQNGVQWKRFGYGNRELLHMLGKKVYLRIDPSDISRVTVWSESDQPLGIAHSNRGLPRNATEEQARQAIKTMKRYDKQLRAAGEAQLHIHEDAADLLIQGQAQKAREIAARRSPLPLPPPLISPVRSDLEGYLPAIRKVMERSDSAPARPAFDLVAAMDAEEPASPPLGIPSLLDLVGDDDE